MLSNEEYNALKNLLPQPVAPIIKQEEDPSSFIEQLGVGGYSALNEAAMGLPDFLIKQIAGNEAYEKLKALRQKNELANTIGQVAGIGGSFLIPAGWVGKAAGAGLKGIGNLSKIDKIADAGQALTNAGNWVSKGYQAGDKIGGSIAKGLITGAEQAIPRAITGGATEGNWGEQLANAGLGIGAGGAFGALGHTILKPLMTRYSPKGYTTPTEAEKLGLKSYTGGKLTELQEGLNKQVLEGSGLTNSAVNRSMRFLYGSNAATKGKHIDDFYDEMADVIRKYNLKNDADFDNLKAINSAKWNEISDDFAKKAPDNWKEGLRTKILNDADIVKTAQKLDNPEKALKDINNIIDDSKSISDVRNGLSDNFRLYSNGNTTDDFLKTDLSAISKRLTDEHFLDVANVNKKVLNELKQEYKITQLYDTAKGLNRGGALFTAGSSTAEKGILNSFSKLNNPVGGALTGAGLSGVMDTAKGEQVDVGKALTFGLLGAAGGPMLSKAGAKGANLLFNKVLGKVNLKETTRKFLTAKEERAFNINIKKIEEKLGRKLTDEERYSRLNNARYQKAVGDENARLDADVMKKEKELGRGLTSEELTSMLTQTKTDKIMTNLMESQKPELTGEEAIQHFMEKYSKTPTNLLSKSTAILNDAPVQEQKEISNKIMENMPADIAMQTTQDYVSKLSPVFKKKLMDIYSKHYSELDPQDFLDKVMAKTNNFQNMNANVDLLFAPDDVDGKAKFLERYNTYLVGKEFKFTNEKGGLGKVISGGGGFNLGPIKLGGDTEAANTQNKLVNYLVNMQIKGDITKKDTAEKNIRKAISMVKDNPALLPDFLSFYGLSGDDIKQTVGDLI